MESNPNKNETIPVKFPKNEDLEKIDSIARKIAIAKQNINALKEDYFRLEKIRTNYEIRLQQCDEEYERLHEVYNKIRIKYILSVDERKDLENYLGKKQIKETEVVDEKEHVPSPSPTPSHSPTSPPSSSQSEQKLSSIVITPQIYSLSNGFFGNKVSLKHTLRTTQTTICSIQFSNDGSILAFSDSKNIFIVEPEDGFLIKSISLPPSDGINPYYARVIQFSPNDKYIAVSGPNYTILLYDIGTKGLLHTFHGHRKDVNSIIFGSKENTLITAGFDGYINVWDLNSYELVKHLEHGDNAPNGIISRVVTSTKFSFYAVGFANGRIGIYDNKFEQPMMSYPAHQQTLLTIAVSPCNNDIATSSKDNTIKIWSLHGIATLRHTLEGHKNFPLVVTFSPFENLVFSGSKDQTIRIWEQKTGEQLCGIKVHQDTIFGIAHHPSLRCFASCSGEGTVCIWKYYSPE